MSVEQSASDEAKQSINEAVLPEAKIAIHLTPRNTNKTNTFLNKN